MSLERILKFFYRVKPRFGRADFDRVVAVRGERVADLLLRERNLALRVLRAAASVEQRRFAGFELCHWGRLRDRWRLHSVVSAASARSLGDNRADRSS